MITTTNQSTVLQALPEHLGAVNAFLEPLGFLADAMFTPRPVDEVAGLLDVFDVESMIPRSIHSPNANGTGARRGQVKTSQQTYFCEPFKVEGVLTHTQKARFKNRFDLMERESKRVALELKILRDARAAAQFWNRTYFPADNVAGSIAAVNWATTATSDPRTDLQIANATARTRFGARGYSRIVMDDRAWDLFWRSNSIRNSYSGIMVLGTPVTTDATAKKWLCEQLGISEVVIIDSMINSAKEGQAASISRVLPAGFVLLLEPRRGPTDPMPGFGEMLYFAELGGLLAIDGYLEPCEEQDIVRAKECIDFAVYNSACAHLLGIAGT